MTDSIVRALSRIVAGQRIIVFCSQRADEPEWQRLCQAAGAEALVLAFDAPAVAELLPPPKTRSATQLISDRHALLATLGSDSPLTRLVEEFDPAEQALLLVTDPLDPREFGARRSLGQKHPSWELFEHKSVVDTLWDTIGLERSESLVFDDPGALLRHDTLVATADVVVSVQPRGSTPSAGGEGVRRVTNAVELSSGPFRVRAMPQLAGSPCRLHGLVLAETTVVFPPLELLVPLRLTDGTYLCAGTWPIPTAGRGRLSELTRWIGDRLRERLAYRGGFSVDGILTAGGFRPTDLNTRITSAFETVPPPVRVAVQVCAALARAEQPTWGAPVLELHADRVFGEADTLVLRSPIVGDATHSTLPVSWDGQVLVAADQADADGTLRIVTAARGTVLHAALRRARLPSALGAQAVAVAVFGAADRLFGTTFGPLEPPGHHRPIPGRRAARLGETVTRAE
ncbi:hypothetical protein [Micromonospora chalcea]|uniref:hypothetical protein n=1 Tax=Micromonospora chalcea TaxID=1874 RepID=UPI0038F68A21